MYFFGGFIVGCAILWAIDRIKFWRWCQQEEQAKLAGLFDIRFDWSTIYMAKGRNWRGDGQPSTDAAMGGPGSRHMTHLEVHRDGEGKYLVSHHYENSGKEGLGNDYREKPHRLATAAAMGAHVMKHAESIMPSGAKDERPEEDEYDNEGGNENER